MRLQNCDIKMFHDLETKARYEEYSLVLGILKKCASGQLTRTRLIEIIQQTHQYVNPEGTIESWPQAVIEQILEDLHVLGWLKTDSIEIIKMIPVKNGRSPKS